MAENRIGIIGGSGFYNVEGFKVQDESFVETPFGSPSDSYVLGQIADREVVFLPRHGKGHRLLPSELNFRANIYGFKKLGVSRLISVAAVGSLKEEIAPRHIVVPDQFIDRTRRRKDTFFGDGIVAHVSFAEPVCAELSSLLTSEAQAHGATVHQGGTYVCIEGPAFSSRAESAIYRSWGASVIGMTSLQEAKLAREAEMCYAVMALVTDYDCWKHGEEVSVEMLLENLKANAETAGKIIERLIPSIPPQSTCPCACALQDALLTRLDQMPHATKKKLDIIIGKYIE